MRSDVCVVHDRSVDTIWTAVIAGGIAVLGTLAGAQLGRNIEHRQWRRNARREAYLAFVQAVDACTVLRADIAHDEGVTQEEVNTLLIALERAARDVMIVGPTVLLDQAEHLYQLIAPYVLDDGDDIHLPALSHIRTEVTRFAANARTVLDTRR